MSEERNPHPRKNLPNGFGVIDGILIAGAILGAGYGLYLAEKQDSPQGGYILIGAAIGFFLPATIIFG